MGYWQQSVITDVGAEMLNDLMAGRKMTICSAWSGTESVEAETLAQQTDVCGERHELGLLGLEKLPEGKLVRVQISNTGLDDGYTICQIGVFAKVDDEPEQLLFILQEERGVEVPPLSENPSFSLEVQGLICITNNVEIKVSLEGSSAVITLAYLNETLGKHDASPDAHQDIRKAIQQLRDNSSQNTEALKNLAGQLLPLEFDLTIPADSWEENEDPSLPAYSVDVPVEGVTADMVPYLSLYPGSLTAAGECGLSTLVQSVDGGLRLYAKMIPAEDMQISAMLFRGQDGRPEGATAEYGAGQGKERSLWLGEV